MEACSTGPLSHSQGFGRPGGTEGERTFCKAARGYFGPFVLHRMSLARGKGGWLSCLAAVSGSRYKILNAR